MSERWQTVGNIIKNKLRLHRGAEIGVWKGKTSEYLLKRFGKLHMICVDPYKKYYEYDRYHAGATFKTQKEFDRLYEDAKLRLSPYKNRVIWIRDTSSGAANKVNSKSLDFVFIDGNHCFEHVRANILQWLPKLRDGGVMIGHDIDSSRGSINSVRNAVEFCFAENYKEIDRCWYCTLEKTHG